MGRKGYELHSHVKLPVLPASLDIGLPEVGEAWEIFDVRRFASPARLDLTTQPIGGIPS
jgi:hypothetical protein